MHIETHSGLDIGWDLTEMRMMIMRVKGWAGLIGLRRTSIWKTWFQLKWATGVGRKGQPQGVDLSLDFWHWPGSRTSLKNPHMASEVLTGVRVELGIWRGDGNLQMLDAYHESKSVW